MYEAWKSLSKKSVNQMAAGMKQKYDVFMDELDDLFDIASADALTTMTNEEDREFLEKQRQKGRPGSMLGIDMKLAAKEHRTELRKEKEKEKIKKEEDRNLRENESHLQEFGKYFE